MPADFHDRRTVAAAFTLAIFGWGLGFYGPPIFFEAVLERTGWTTAFASWIVTVHHLVAAGVILRMPRLHERFGIIPVTIAGTATGALGIVGWSLASKPLELVAAALLSGAGWGCTGGACITAVIARWYSGPRAAGLTTAYNGATIGGALFSAMWPWLITVQGFTAAAVLVGCAACMAVAAASWLGLRGTGASPPAPASASARLPMKAVLTDRRLRSLAMGMSLSLFAQIGVLAHLFALCTPRLGARAAGWLVGGAVALAIAGRQISWRFGLGRNIHPRRVALVFLGSQAAGCLLLAAVPSTGIGLLVSGCVLFGLGIGTATSLPAVIAQFEFEAAVAARATALVLATAQATYSFAPAVLGLMLPNASRPVEIGRGTSPFFLVVAAIEVCAALALSPLFARSNSSRWSRGFASRQ